MSTLLRHLSDLPHTDPNAQQIYKAIEVCIEACHQLVGIVQRPEVTAAEAAYAVSSFFFHGRQRGRLCAGLLTDSVTISQTALR